MSNPRKATVRVKGTAITVLVHREQDYISLTDIAKHKEPGFKPLEFEGFRNRAGLNSFV